MRVLVLRWPAEALRTRIDRRAEAMVQSGLLTEVRALLDAGVNPNCAPMRSVGYREAVEVLTQIQPVEGLADRIARSTWAYARRQRTWFKKERDVHWVDITDLDETAEGLIDGSLPA